MPENKRNKWLEEHPRQVFTIAGVIGVCLPIALFYLGAYISMGTFSFPIGIGYSFNEIIIVGIMLSVITGDYVGRSFLASNQTTVFLLSFFATSMVFIGVGRSPIFFLVIVLAIGIGVLELIDVIKEDKISGKSLKYIRQTFVSLIGGGVNFVSIAPSLRIYVGSWSEASWLLVLILIGFVWKESLSLTLLPYLKDKWKHRRWRLGIYNE